jgi:hypothetical protein
VPDQADAEILEIVGGQVRQYAFVDRVVAKRRFVLLHAEAMEPGRDVYASPPRRGRHRAPYLNGNAGRARGISAVVDWLVAET